MMTVEENRKRVRRNNLLVSLLFLVMITGIAGAVYYYRNLKIAKKTVQKKSEEVDSLNNILTDQNIKLQKATDFVDSISKLKIRLDSISFAQNPQNETYRLQEKLNNVLLPVISSRDSAREHARKGYDKLISKDLKGAMEEFDKSEKFYNGYHEPGEIHALLKNNEAKLEDTAVQKQLLIKIKNDYNSLQKLNSRNIQ